MELKFAKMREGKKAFGSGDPNLPRWFRPGRRRSHESSSQPGSGRSPDLPRNLKRNPKFPEGYHFITLVVSQRIPIFKFSSLARSAKQALEFYAKRGDYELHGFVVMPDHIHFVCDSQKPISEVVRDIKKYISKKAVQYLSGENSNLLNKLKLKEHRKRKHIHQIWQRDFYDFNIVTERKLQEKLRYMYENPLRRGLCNQIQDYEFSDVNRYFGSGDPNLPT